MKKEEIWIFLVNYLLEYASGANSVSDVLDTASFADDLYMDSLDVIELIMAIEVKFSIEILNDDALKFKTVGDVREYLENRLS